jgi:hypothetical protein
MRRILLPFVLKLIAASVLLYLVWEWKGRVWYVLLFRDVATPICSLLGKELGTLRDALAITIDRFYNILPFLSIMVAAWGITWKRRVIGALIGFAVLVLWHVAFTLIVDAIITAHGLDATAYKELSPWFLFSDALPFVLWVIIAYKPLTDIFASAKKGKSQKPS